MLLDIFLNICLPILVVMGVGWLFDRKFDLNLDTLVKLNLYVFVPSFIFIRLIESDLSDREGFTVIFFSLLVMAVMWLASWAVSRDSKERISMQLGTMFYNSGNWGIPLMALAFPGLGPVVQVFVLTTMNASLFTIGVFMAGMHSHRDGEESSPAWRRLLPALRQPSVYAVIAALILRRFGNPLEDIVFIWKPLGYLADALVAFALITLGVQLSKTKPPRVGGRLAWAIGIRLLGGPMAAAGLALAFGFDGELAAVLILGAASPTAVNASLLAHEFKADSRFTAAVVFYTTLFAVVVVTLLLAILRSGWIPWAHVGAG